MSASEKTFYVTTPIYYVNARPHIGHAYTTIVADVLARRHRLLGDDTFFLTGTDEHGQKIERSAAAAGIPPQQFADQVSASFEALWKRMGITNDAYIRTTDPHHQRGVQKLFSELYANGFIELKAYTGTYCVSDEAFVDVPVGAPCPECGRITEEVTEENFFFRLSEFQLPLLDLIEGKTLEIENTARRNEIISFLRGDFSEIYDDYFNQFLKERAQTNSDKNTDQSDAEEWGLVQGRVKKTAKGTNYVPSALKDLSVSRSSFTWGIPVPEPAASAAAQKHVIYVWLDALANYMTALGYGSDDTTLFDKFWPADLHLVGKEIIRFHCVYWPAFLLALNPAYHSEDRDFKVVGVQSVFAPLHLQESKTLPVPLSSEQHFAWANEFLPKAITAHGWLLFDNSKMSKSKGNIVRTETILDGFGDHVYGKQFPESTKAERDLFAADVLRYFLLREIPFGQDGSFSFEALWQRYDSDLCNKYGNLVNRIVTMIANYFDGYIPEAPTDRELIQDAKAWIATSAKIPHAHGYSFTRLLEELFRQAASIDETLSIIAPWKLAKKALSGDPEARNKLNATLYTMAEYIRVLTALLNPFLPDATAKVWAQLGLGDIELAAKNGELTNLTWGGLKPGTKLGPLAPIFPRADKSLAETMHTMENPETKLTTEGSELTTESTTHRPEAPLKQAFTPTPASPVNEDRLDPAAPPRAFTPATGQVAGTDSMTTHTGPTPSFSEAPASGAFANAASQTPITAGPADASPQITIDDFAKIELRVAQIVVAERIPKADKLLRLEVDLGYEKRQILSGIAEFYTPEELVGRRIVVITNLAPRKMRGLESHGMLLAASEGDHGKPALATCGDEIALGARLK